MGDIKFEPGTKLVFIEEVEINGKSGYMLSTTTGNVLLAIGNSQHCCENWGYFIECKEDDLNHYTGAEIRSVVWSGDIDNPLGDDLSNSVNESCVRIITDHGDIDLWVYNDHNGYYAHCCLIQAFDFEEEFYL